MDLRTIMNSDAGGASNSPPATQSSGPPSDASHQSRAQPPSYPDYAARPPHPPLLHTSPSQSSPYGPTQSPYQQLNAPKPNTAVQSQRSQSPPHVSTPYGPGARDPYGAAYPNPQHPAGPLASPYTPQPMSAGPQHPEQSSQFAQQRSYSLQSVMTNPHAPNESFRPQDSPPSASQPLPSQQFSPSAHRSVPGTPLGPPPAFSTHQSPLSTRPQSSGRDSPRNPLSSPRPAVDIQSREPGPTQSPVTQRQFSPRGSRPPELPSHPHPANLKQEPRESASPKTVSRQNSAAATSEDRRWNESPTSSLHPGAGSDVRPSPSALGHTPINSSPSGPGVGAHPLKMEVDHEQEPRPEIQPPRPKRRRYDEPPVYAQRSVRTKGKCPVIPKCQPPIPKHARKAYHDSWATRRQSSPGAGSAVPAPTRATPGPAAQSPTTNEPSSQPPSLNPPPSNPPKVGSLGRWEPSISGYIPYEEVTKLLCDFLFQHVVMRNDVAAGPAGSAAAGQGAIIEVEAKLGHVMDMDRGDRLHLPVLTETAINRENPRFRTSFESSMTIEQHRAMNNFLNETVKASLPQSGPDRIPLSYAHKKERDTFYEVSPAELPPVIRQNLNPRHKPKVRVTTDQRTGEVLAKIIKCRVADIDVCSPRTTVDWRVSVNLEMEYPGDVHHLPVVDASKGGRGERNKDRMSYRHLAYQIDLTQVARAEPPTKNDFEHELEIEVSGAEIRRQGQLAISGDPTNQYEDLIKGFVDNIRILARAVPP